MGAVVGHEMTHGYDDQGRKYDSKGNLTNWWTDADGEEFNRRAAVMVAQANAFVVHSAAAAAECKGAADGPLKLKGGFGSVCACKTVNGSLTNGCAHPTHGYLRPGTQPHPRATELHPPHATHSTDFTLMVQCPCPCVSVQRGPGRPGRTEARICGVQGRGARGGAGQGRLHPVAALLPRLGAGARAGGGLLRVVLVFSAVGMVVSPERDE